jgi:hypothetical protein
MLRNALMHRAPTRDRTRYGGPLDSDLGGDLDTTAPGSLG